MSYPAIRVDNLGKRYRIGTPESHYTTFREALVNLAQAPFRGLRGPGSPVPETDLIWALRDVSFDVQSGQVVGVIGRNGAGKSTLLKILSRITKPTTGRVEIRGRVGSLLDIGTGFHPELTGRENIYFNGAVLGMSAAEIKAKFDAIVDFSGVEPFLEMPIKYYSNGMAVRLAFAVAAHLEPEILLADEVLAVGDAAFQKKCIGKMSEVARQGRTVLFVSHDMVAVEALCEHCFYFEKGGLKAVGDTKDVLALYQRLVLNVDSGSKVLLSHPGRIDYSQPLMTHVSLLSEDDKPVCHLPMGAPLSVRVAFSSRSHPLCPFLGVTVKTLLGSTVLAVNNRFIPGYNFTRHDSEGTITCYFDRLPLMPGAYVLDLALGDELQDLDIVREAITFEVTPADVFGSGKLPPGGRVYWPASWSLQNGDGAVATMP